MHLKLLSVKWRPCCLSLNVLKNDLCSHFAVVALYVTGIIFCMRPANNRWHCNMTSSLIGWVHTPNDPWCNICDIWPCCYETLLYFIIHSYVHSFTFLHFPSDNQQLPHEKEFMHRHCLKFWKFKVLSKLNYQKGGHIDNSVNVLLLLIIIKPYLQHFLCYGVGFHD